MGAHAVVERVTSLQSRRATAAPLGPPRPPLGTCHAESVRNLPEAMRPPPSTSNLPGEPQMLLPPSSGNAPRSPSPARGSGGAGRRRRRLAELVPRLELPRAHPAGVASRAPRGTSDERVVWVTGAVDTWPAPAKLPSGKRPKRLTGTGARKRNESAAIYGYRSRRHGRSDALRSASSAESAPQHPKPASCLTRERSLVRTQPRPLFRPPVSAYSVPGGPLRKRLSTVRTVRTTPSLSRDHALTRTSWPLTASGLGP
jgi:hypothetical protein